MERCCFACLQGRRAENGGVRLVRSVGSWDYIPGDSELRHCHENISISLQLMSSYMCVATRKCSGNNAPEHGCCDVSSIASCSDFLRVNARRPDDPGDCLINKPHLKTAIYSLRTV